MEHKSHQEHGQSIVLVAFIFVALLLFVAIAIDAGNAYMHRRWAQNGADAGTLAGARALGRSIDGQEVTDLEVKIAIDNYAELNHITDTNNTPGDGVNDNVIGCYLDRDAVCLDGQPVLGSAFRVGALGYVPDDAFGIEVVTLITSTTYFAQMIGVDSMPLQAEAASLFESTCEAQGCVLPLAVHRDVMNEELVEGECYNLWDGGGTGSFGWLNWSAQGFSCFYYYDFAFCQDNECDCDGQCLAYNLNPETCLDGLSVGEEVYGTVGVKNNDTIRGYLSDWVVDPAPVQLVVYDGVDGNGCGVGWPPGSEVGLHYTVVGFGSFDVTGYRLASGQGNRCDLLKNGELFCKTDKEDDPWGPEDYVAYPGDDPVLGCADTPSVCIDPTTGEACDWETGSVNRVTGIFHKSTSGDTGNCYAIGNLLAPRLIK